MSPTVIIPSRNADNLTACLSAIREHEPGLPVIVVDDGLRCRPDGPVYINGISPFVFSRNVNAGIEAAASDSVLVLNDDALLKTPRGFSIMEQQWRDHPEYGLIASSVDNCGTPEQIRQGDSELRQLPVMAVFIAVFIPRSTIDLIGGMDERYGVNAGGSGVRGYGVCDADYSKSVRSAGLKLGVSDLCFVTHTELPSTFRHRDRKPGEPKTADVRLHERLYLEKWGERPYV